MFLSLVAKDRNCAAPLFSKGTSVQGVSVKEREKGQNVVIDRYFYRQINRPIPIVKFRQGEKIEFLHKFRPKNGPK